MDTNNTICPTQFWVYGCIVRSLHAGVAVNLRTKTCRLDHNYTGHNYITCVPKPADWTYPPPALH